jgi:hypothetical protein
MLPDPFEGYDADEEKSVSAAFEIVCVCPIGAKEVWYTEIICLSFSEQ